MELLDEFEYDLYRLNAPFNFDEESEDSEEENEEMRAHRRENVHRLDAFYLCRADLLQHFDDAKLYKTFRFDRESINMITELVRYKIERPTNRKRALSPLCQVLIALQYYATGVFQTVVGNVLHVSQSSVCRAVHDVTLALCEKSNEFIKFSEDNFRTVIKVLKPVIF